MKRVASAPGKMILSGEYAVVFGHPGIAVPSPLRVTVSFEPEGQGDLTLHDEHLAAPGCRSYLETIVMECERVAAKKFHGTLRIESRIPLGRGMGSSTAIVIGVCRALLGNDCESRAMEINDHVDPGNSGLDFAVIWSNRPTLFRKGETSRSIDLDLSFLEQAVLIDTGKPNEATAELVAWMKLRVEAGGEEAASLNDAFAMIGSCTQALLDGEHPLTVFPDHHRAQLALGVVPDATHQLILAIEEAGGAAKVLGAGARTGGGGMVLALHSDPDMIADIIEPHSQFSILHS